MERVTTQLPGNLVLEQDFILQIRRLQKTGERKLVLNVQFAQMPNLTGKRDLLTRRRTACTRSPASRAVNCT